MSFASSFAAWLAWAAPAGACPYEGTETTTRTDADGHVIVSVPAAVAAHCARSSALVGANCSYTTGMVARRVVEEGDDWIYTGLLTVAPNTLSSHVAAPFTAAAGDYVVANELLEALQARGSAGARLSLGGRVLEVDGVRYVVITSFEVVSS